MGDGESIEVFVCYKIISVAAFGSAIRLRAKTSLNRIRILPDPVLTFFKPICIFKVSVFFTF